MSDPDYPAIETTSGDRPRNSLAERGIVVLAVLALAAGGLIALGNLLGNETGVSKASSTPAARATPRPTPKPTAGPTPVSREIILIAGTPPSMRPADGQPWPFGGWIRALADQPLLLTANAMGPTMGVFRAGEIAYADEQPDSPGLLNIHGDSGESRWVRLEGGGTRLVEKVTAAPVLGSGDIWGLSAGPKGFLALINPPTLVNRASRSFVAYSADGVDWQRGDLPPYVSTVAWGPAGWLAIGTIEDPIGSPTLWVFASGDGRTWTPLGAAAEGDPGLQYAGQLLGSDGGYLLQAWGSYSQELWFSADGVTWTQSLDPDLPGINSRGDRHLAAVGSGFLAWEENGPIAPAQLAYSTDGRSWLPIQGAPRGINLNFSSLGDRIIAAVTDPENGRVTFRTGTFNRSEFVWDPPSAPVADAGLAVLVSDTRRVTALLWDRTTDRPIEWSSTNGRDWQSFPLPQGTFGGIPRISASGVGGVVAVGYRMTARGSNSIMWREDAPGRWTHETSPMLPLVPDPLPTACGQPPQDFLGFTVLDRPLAAVCLGDAPLTFRAWSVACEGCYGESPGYDPAWLANATTNQLFLSPIAADIGANNQVVLSPMLTRDPAWINHWVEVTGHFDDPAAATCHWTPSPSDDPYYSGQYWIVEGCRQQFVVSAVRPADGPDAAR